MICLAARLHRAGSTLAVCAMLFGVVASTVANGQDTGSSNEAVPIDLGFKPDPACAGGVLVVREASAYLTFTAQQGGADGIAVIQLPACQEWDFRSGGDEELASHPVDPDSLDFCETYQVENSDWAGGDAVQKHFIVTFLGFNPVTEGAVHFECVAADAVPHFLTTDSFETVLAYVDYLEGEPIGSGDAGSDPYGDPGSEDPGSDPGNEDPGSDPYGGGDVGDPYGDSGDQNPYEDSGSQNPYGDPGSQDPYGDPAGQDPYGYSGGYE